jgi:hypothetical protein
MSELILNLINPLTRRDIKMPTDTMEKCVERERQVSEQVGRISKFLDEADGLINHLYGRLEVVLRQELRDPETDTNEPSELVALAHELKCQADRIEGHNGWLSSILDRLEL